MRVSRVLSDFTANMTLMQHPFLQTRLWTPNHAGKTTIANVKEMPLLQLTLNTKLVLYAVRTNKKFIKRANKRILCACSSVNMHV